MSRLAIAEEFAWPSMEELYAYEHNADVHAFVGWLVERDEIAGLSRIALDALHIEFCCIHKLRPLTPRKLAQLGPSAGIIKARPSVYIRPDDGPRREIRRTVYSVSPLVLFQYDMQERRAA